MEVQAPVLADIDLDLHAQAKEFAEVQATRHRNYVGPASHIIAKAYLDLLARRGLPTPLKCYPSIQLISGSYFDFNNPETSIILPEDIAHALAKTSRCNGHTLGDLIYSVCQHSVYACRKAPRGFRFEALMHDAAEYVVGDVTSPLKGMLPDFKVVETRVEHAIRSKFYLPLTMSPEVKLVDHRVAATEKRDLMPPDPPGECWESLAGAAPYDDLKIEVWDVATARSAWLEHFYQLWPEHRAKLVIP